MTRKYELPCTVLVFRGLSALKRVKMLLRTVSIAILFSHVIVVQTNAIIACNVTNAAVYKH
jgi:hypothetical protein